MNRRTSLATLLGKKTSPPIAEKPVIKQNISTTKPMLNSGLEPYAGEWTFEQAAHLLRRATFGPTYTQMKTAVSEGMDNIVAQLLEDLPMPEEPINYFFQEDPNVPVGETWVNAPTLEDVNVTGYRARSLRAWTFRNVIHEGINIREKMVLFWHNHFVSAFNNDPRYTYRYSQTLRENALGNFREFVKKITIEPSMLRYLNGNENSVQAPNENYARELMELFTLGKGELAGPGDYTTFTEDDVIAMAKVLTGWRDVGLNSDNPDIEIGAVFRPFRHDTSTKQLSHRFDNVIITNNDEEEYIDLINLIFQREEPAYFICRKLYRWFLYYTIDENAEANVIAPMAQLMIENDYNIKPVLEALFKSAHFYDILNMGPMIKNPLDFILSIIKQFELNAYNNIIQEYFLWNQLFRLSEPLEMVYYAPPDVAGWKAYYQEPAYYRIWINSVTLPLRTEFTNRMATTGIALGDRQINLDVLTFVTTIDTPEDPNLLIEAFVKILFPRPITDSQKANLKEILIPGLPDFEWTVEYGQYAENPEDSDLADAIEAKLRTLVATMMSMPEYYLS